MSSALRNILQMMKVVLSIVVIAFLAKATSQQQRQLPVVTFDMNDFMAHQQAFERQSQMQHMQPPMHSQESDPMVGTPLGLGGLNLKLNPLNPFNPFNLGLPGLRFSNINTGHIGGLAFGNSLLGAANPMENEGDSELESKHKFHKHKHIHHFESDVGAAGPPQHFDFDQQLEAIPPTQYQFEQLPPSSFQAEPQVGFWPFFHLANPDMELGQAPPSNAKIMFLPTYLAI